MPGRFVGRHATTQASAVERGSLHADGNDAEPGQAIERGSPADGPGGHLEPGGACQLDGSGIDRMPLDRDAATTELERRGDDRVVEVGRVEPAWPGRGSPADMVGKKVGIQPTGVVLLRALLAKNNIPDSAVEIIPIGADMAPLLTGQVDVVTGWQTNVTALKVLGPDRVDLRLWDAGVRLYALPYYATVKTIQTHPDVLQKFLRATAKGYAYANANRGASADLLVKEYPNLNRDDEKVGIDAMMGYAFNDLTKAGGWGTMDPAVWQDQISLYSQLGQFSKRTPKLDEVMTMEILTATRDARLKV